MAKEIITQNRLKELLNYDPDTGIFRWIRTIGSRAKMNGIAGTKSHNGYLIISLDRCRYRAHRLAYLYMTGCFPSKYTDHINHIRDDNRWSNLRAVTRQENMMNACIGSNNKSGVVGVHWDKARSKWCAKIKLNGKNIHIGRYDDIFHAACARKSAEMEHGFHKNHGATPIPIR